MERSLFPDGVVVKQKDLVYTDQAKIQQILRRHTNMGVMGVVSGGVIQVSSNTFGVKIVPFVAYTPSGELINYQSILDNVPLADVTANALNYILAVYTEIEGSPSPHESLGLQMNTRITAACRIRVLDAATYAALPATSTNMNNDTLDRAVLLAIVTAQGNGIALQSGNIKNSTAWTDVLSVSGSVITGVGIVSVSPDTQVGIGTLTYTPASGGSQDKLAWRAPNDSIGAAVDIPGDGTYTLYSAGGQTLVVTVILSSLPGGVVQVNDTLNVTSLYSQEVPRFTARDDQHRHMVGSGTPTAKNPHGLTVGDLSGGGTDPLIQEHQDVFHANGIIKNGVWGPARATLKPTIQHGNNPTVDSVGIGGIGVGEITVVNGMTLTELNGSPTVSFQDIQTGYIELWGVYIDSTGTLTKSKRARMNFDGGAWGQTNQDPLGGVFQVVNVSDDWTAQTDVTIELNTWPLPLNLYDPVTDLRGAGINIPATSGVVRLMWHDNVKWVDVYVHVPNVAGLNTPAVSNMRIYPKMDSDTHLMLAYVTSHGTASPILGYGQWNVVSVLTDNIIDTRRFGTTDISNLRDDAVDEITPQLVRDTIGNGYVTGFTSPIQPPGNDITIPGGVIYYNGSRHAVDSRVLENLADGTHYIYISVDGYHHATMYETTTLATANTGLLLYTVVVAAGLITSTTLNARKVVLATAEDLNGHINDSSAAHDASAISFNSGVANMASTDVQAAIKESYYRHYDMGLAVTSVARIQATDGWHDICSSTSTWSGKRPIMVHLMSEPTISDQISYITAFPLTTITTFGLALSVSENGAPDDIRATWKLVCLANGQDIQTMAAWPQLFTTVAAGPVTFKLKAARLSGNGYMDINWVKLVAYEI